MKRCSKKDFYTSPSQWAPVLMLLTAFPSFAGCSTVNVEKYDGTGDPKGIPFYLTKPMKKVTASLYEFRDLQAGAKLLWTTELVDVEIINVIDTSQKFTINKTKAFAGETKFEFQRTVPADPSKGEASSADLSIVKTEDKEGITEFLKGLVEGAKTAVEAAKALKETGVGFRANLVGTPDGEAAFIRELLKEHKILVVKKVKVDLQPI